MKVKDLLEQLKTYKPDTDLIVAYWDKETVQDYGAPEMTDEQWSQVVDEYEDGEWHFQSSAAEDFVEISERVVSSEDLE